MMNKTPLKLQKKYLKVYKASREFGCVIAINKHFPIRKDVDPDALIRKQEGCDIAKLLYYNLPAVTLESRA